MAAKADTNLACRRDGFVDLAHLLVDVEARATQLAKGTRRCTHDLNQAALRGGLGMDLLTSLFTSFGKEPARGSWKEDGEHG